MTSGTISPSPRENFVLDSSLSLMEVMHTSAKYHPSLISDRSGSSISGASPASVKLGMVNRWFFSFEIISRSLTGDVGSFKSLTSPVKANYPWVSDPESRSYSSATACLAIACATLAAVKFIEKNSGSWARGSCKSLFDKIKASHPEIVTDGKSLTAS
ncbi:hypothetical protein VTL71DRAFT_15821 [Oculimacula yallundae]|uniref:Uncharacterized protein n=1 Tax=Oculimacula yallundae TaxID=86028 RepID=A0ABR4CCR5_9HELO